MKSTITNSDSNTSWLKRLKKWNASTKTWNWGLIAIVGIVVAIIVFIATIYIGDYRRSAFQNHIYCEVLKRGMSPQEIDTALDRIGKHIQVDITDQIVLNMAIKPASYRLVLFENANIDVRMGLGYDTNQKLIWVTRGEVPPQQVVQCP